MDARLRRITNALLGKPDKDSDEYYQALGEFVSSYAGIEGWLQRALWKIAGLKKPTAQAVLSGVRTDEAIKRIYRIADARKWPKPKKEKFKYVFDQLLILNKFRNDILHYGTDLQADGTWISTNKPFVHLTTKTTIVPSTKEILMDANADLFQIRIRLTELVWGLPFSVKEERDKILSPSWRYKPAQQSQKGHKTPPNPQKRQRLPKSSQA